MRHLKRISEAEMIAVFLRTELSSSRIVPTISELVQRDGRDRSVISDPDLSNTADNVYRRQVLGAYRGYGRDAELFAGFPSRTRWYRAVATKDDLTRVRYINYDYWNELSGGSRMPADAAARIRQGIEIFNVSNAGFWHLADAIAAGAIFPEMIMVGAWKGAPLTLLEGHARLTAYFLRPEAIPSAMHVIVGYARDIVAWGLY